MNGFERPHRMMASSPPTLYPSKRSALARTAEGSDGSEEVRRSAEGERGARGMGTQQGTRRRPGGLRRVSGAMMSGELQTADSRFMTGTFCGSRGQAPTADVDAD